MPSVDARSSNDNINTASYQQRKEQVLSLVLAQVAKLGGTALPDLPFMEAGIDSLGKLNALGL